MRRQLGLPDAATPRVAGTDDLYGYGTSLAVRDVGRRCD